MTAPECWGAAVAALAQPPLAPGLPVSWWGGQAREPTRKVQLAVWAKDRAVTKAVLRAGESRERKAGGAQGWPPGTPVTGAGHPAQGHVATASR